MRDLLLYLPVMVFLVFQTALLVTLAKALMRVDQQAREERREWREERQALLKAAVPSLMLPFEEPAGASYLLDGRREWEIEQAHRKAQGLEVQDLAPDG